MRLVEPGYQILQPEPLDQAAADRILALIERAGRTCYKSEDRITTDSAAKFVRMIIKRGHESVLEHAVISVLFTCDRGVSHELVRHRIAAYSQESTRYCNYGKEKHGGQIAFIPPRLFWHDEQEEWSIWWGAMEAAEQAYLKLIAKGAMPQQARSVLPNSLKTEVFSTFNLREWRWVFRKRCDKAAHPQIRQVMLPLFQEFREKLAPVFEDLDFEP